MLAFRALDPARERDPGRELKRVLKFRDRIRRERGLLYQTFASIAELEDKLRDWLQEQLFDVVQTRSLAAADRGAQPVPAVKQSTALVAASEESTSLAPPLLKTAAEAVSGMLQQATFDAYVKDATAITLSQLLRLRLHVNAWSYVLHNTEPMGVHDHNSLYQIRDQVTLVPPEQVLIRSAIIGDAQDVLPGWYWFTDDEPENVHASLLRNATTAVTVEARARAVRLLGEAHIRLDEPEITSLLDSAALDDSAQVARAVIAYARDTEDVALLRMIETAVGFGDSITQKERAIGLLGLLTPEEATTEAARLFALAPDEAARVIEANFSSIPEETLATLLADKSNPVVAEVSQRIAIRRGKLSEGELRTLLFSTNVRTREAAIRSLIETGGKITPGEIRTAFRNQSSTIGFALSIGNQDRVDVDALVFELFKKLPEADLRAKLTFLSLDSPIAYRVLGVQHFESFAEQLRNDLETGFESIRPDFLTSSAAVNDLREGTEPEGLQLARFAQELHTEAAVAALAERGGPDDVKVAITLLESGKLIKDVNFPIALITKHGNANDADSLVAYAERSYNSDSLEAALGAIELSPGPEGAARKLLTSPKEELVRVGLRAMLGAGTDAIIACAEPLLGNPRDGVRLAATALLAHELSLDELKEVTRRYRELPTYYYDVGCWLDRVMYAPEPLRAAFERKLYANLAPREAKSELGVFGSIPHLK
ncbi:hypothetical protein [Gemmatimonas sp.]|uniref:hypothetical protein n=1 Tax=Gemmatimonas sp. TaxID=1962908 RepID=UPI003DA2C324